MYQEKDSMRYRPPPLLANAVFVFTTALLVAVCMLFLQDGHGYPATASVHLTRAEFQNLFFTG